MKTVLERALNCTDAQKCKIGSGTVRGICQYMWREWRVRFEDGTTSQSASEERIDCSGLRRIRRCEQSFRIDSAHPRQPLEEIVALLVAYNGDPCLWLSRRPDNKMVPNVKDEQISWITILLSAFYSQKMHYRSKSDEQMLPVT